jgi:single-strand DNA-binding protein
VVTAVGPGSRTLAARSMKNGSEGLGGSLLDPGATPAQQLTGGSQSRAAAHGQAEPASEATVSFAGNLTDDPQVRYTEGAIARATFRVAVSARSRDSEPSFFTVVVWRDQAEHAAESLGRGSRVVVVGRLQQRTWTAEDGSTRQAVEVLADELGPSQATALGDGNHD